MALRLLASALLLVLGVAGPRAFAQSLGTSAATKENLDLPYDALGENEEEEDAPEIVNFYGTTLEGDGFFYILDRSSSMLNSGELEIAKKEVIRNIQEFTDRVKFGIFFFDANLVKYPGGNQAAEASPGGKASGISFVNSTQGGSGSCGQRALSEALKMANNCTAKRKVIVYLADGGGHCNGGDEAQYLQQTLAATSAQNWQRVQINTVGVLELSQIGEQFMRNLAASNGGTYTRISK